MTRRDRRESGRLMLISPERVFYAGLLGRPRKRTSGGYNIYTAIDEHLTITQGGSELVGEIALVPPYVPHNVECKHRAGNGPARGYGEIERKNLRAGGI